MIELAACQASWSLIKHLVTFLSHLNHMEAFSPEGKCNLSLVFFLGLNIPWFPAKTLALDDAFAVSY